MVASRAPREASDVPEKQIDTGSRSAGRMAVDNQVGKDIHPLRSAGGSTMPESLQGFKLSGTQIDGKGLSAPTQENADTQVSSQKGGRDTGHGLQHGGSGGDATHGKDHGGGSGGDDRGSNSASGINDKVKPTQYKSEVRHPGAKPGDYTIDRVTTDGKKVVDTHTGNPKTGGYTETRTEDGHTNTHVYDKDGKQVYGKDFDRDGKGFHEYKVDARGSTTDRFQKANGDWHEYTDHGRYLTDTEHKSNRHGGFTETTNDGRTGSKTVHDQDAQGNFKQTTTTKDGKKTTIDHAVGKNGSYTDKRTDADGHVTTKEHIEKTGGNFTDKVTDAQGGVTTTENTAKPGGDYTETTTGPKGEVTTKEHTVKPGGNYTETTTGPKGEVTTKEHTVGQNGAFRDVTTKPDGTKITFDQKENGSSSELTQNGNKIQSLKTHQMKPDGGFTDRTADGNGTFIHDQSANGDYVEKSFGNDHTLSAPPLEVKASASPEFAQKIRDSISRLPPGERKLLADNGFKYSIGATMEDIDPSLKGQQPRGSAPGTTFNDISGATNNGTKSIQIAETEHGLPSRRMEGTFNHETGHALGDSLEAAKGVSDYAHTKEFDDAYQKDFAKLTDGEKSGIYKYYTQVDEQGRPSEAGKEEAFAEAYASMRGQGSQPGTEQQFLDRFPNTAELIRKKMQELPGN